MDAAPRKLRSIAAASAAAFVLVCALAFLFAAPAIEAKLEAGARAALDAAGIAGVTATLDGRTATLEGAVADEAAKAAAIAAVAAVPGIAAVVDHVQAGGAAEAPAQYLFSAVWDGRTLTLTGHMPGRDARAETVTHARDVLPRAEIADAMDVAPGAPDENWQAIVAAGIAAMEGLSNATMTLAGPKMTFVGRSPDADGRAEAVRILESLPSPYVSSIDIRIGPEPAPPPPYRFGAAYDGVSVALSGVLPSAAVKAEIAAALAKALPDAALDDRTAIDPAAPDGAFADAALLALAQLPRLAAASLALDRRALTFTAIAPDPAARDAARAAFADLPAAYEAKLTLGVAGEAAAEPQTQGGPESPSHVCQADADAALAESGLAFAPKSAELPDAARPAIARLAAIAKACAGMRFQISGHTDASGREADNLKLSAARAGAVVAALSEAGVEPARLSAAGYGSSRPLAAEDSDAGKARNRRIEVIVRP